MWFYPMLMSVSEWAEAKTFIAGFPTAGRVDSLEMYVFLLLALPASLFLALISLF